MSRRDAALELIRHLDIHTLVGAVGRASKVDVVAVREAHLALDAAEKEEANR